MCSSIKIPSNIGNAAQTDLIAPNNGEQVLSRDALRGNARHLCPPIRPRLWPIMHGTFVPLYAQGCDLSCTAPLFPYTPKAVTYHEQPHYCRFMIGHSLVSNSYFLFSYHISVYMRWFRITCVFVPTYSVTYWKCCPN